MICAVDSPFFNKPEMPAEDASAVAYLGAADPVETHPMNNRYNGLRVLNDVEVPHLRSHGEWINAKVVAVDPQARKMRIQYSINDKKGQRDGWVSIPDGCLDLRIPFLAAPCAVNVPALSPLDTSPYANEQRDKRRSDGLMLLAAAAFLAVVVGTMRSQLSDLLRMTGDSVREKFVGMNVSMPFLGERNPVLNINGDSLPLQFAHRKYIHPDRTEYAFRVSEEEYDRLGSSAVFKAFEQYANEALRGDADREGDISGARLEDGTWALVVTY